jgi:hypothetical protein
MDWLDRYAQSSIPEGVNPAGDEGVSTGTTYADPDEEQQAKVFDGKHVNQVILESIMRPMDAIPKDAMKYMMDASGTPLGRLIVDLSIDSRLKPFVNVVKSYIEDGIWAVVETGSEEGLSALQKWYNDMSVYTGNRDVFGLSSKITTDQNLLGVI